MLRKISATALVLGLSISATPVSAGEWRGTTDVGNEQRTPIFHLFYDEGRPSICAFSGLNDEFYLDGDTEATRTQSYGTLVANDEQDPHAFNPGIACNEGQAPG